MLGEGKENIVEIGRMNRDPIDRNRFVVEPVEYGPQGADAAVGRNLEREFVIVARALAQGVGSRCESLGVGEPQADMPARDAPFELVRGSLGYQLAPIEYGDAVGELVCLLQVLGGQQDGDTTGDQVANELPHHVAAARVQA